MFKNLFIGLEITNDKKPISIINKIINNTPTPETDQVLFLFLEKILGIILSILLKAHTTNVPVTVIGTSIIILEKSIL